MRMSESSEARDETSSKETNEQLEEVSVHDDRKPAASVAPEVKKKKVRKKRRAPLVPWKKPKDMPKRPLSAYNLFFQHERERILSAGQPKSGSIPPSSPVQQPDGQKHHEDKTPQLVHDNSRGRGNTEGNESPKSPGSEGGYSSERPRDRRHLRTSGIGFANLTKTIAAKWKAIDQETRSKFESLAAKEKEQYRKAIEVWRQKQEVSNKKEKKTKQGKQKKETQTSPEQPSLPVFNEDSKDEPMYDAKVKLPPTNQESSKDPRESPILSAAREVPQEAALEVDLRSCEAIAADHLKRITQSDVVQNSLEALDSHLDDETADFITNLQFE